MYCAAIATDYRDFSKNDRKIMCKIGSPKPEFENPAHALNAIAAPHPHDVQKLHTNGTYLTSLRCSPGGSDCSSFAAFSPSCTLRV